MNIVLTNDDGVQSYGIRKLAEDLVKLGHYVTVVAPTKNYSGCSHSMTFFQRVKLYKILENDNCCIYSMDGSPVDCVRFACSIINKNKDIDLVISGVNDMPNAGSDIMYSGTFNGAYEGTFIGINSIAISANNKNLVDDAINFLIHNLDTLKNSFFEKNYTLNINVPNSLDKVKGVVICPVGEKRYTDIYEIFDDCDDCEKEFILSGDPIYVKNNPQNCDVNLLEKDYITISAITVKTTDEEYLKTLNDKGIKFI